MNKKIYYNQADSRWANHKYTSYMHPKATLKTSGCGPTSLAMLISSITDKVIKPDVMADILKLNGYRAQEGTSMDSCKFVGDFYGLEYKKVNSDDLLLNYLKNGYVAVISVSGGSVFSTGGHIIFLCGYENGKIQVHDPYLYKGKFNSYGRNGKVTVSGNDVYISSEKWKQYAKSNIKYVFKVPADKKDGKYTGRVLVNIPIKIAYKGSDNPQENSIVDSNGYQFWISNSVIKDNHVYGLGDICFYQGNGLYIVQIFDKQFWCREEYLSDKF